MKRFRKRFLTKKPAIRVAKKLSLDAYDCMLVGSDQVWNPELTVGLDDAYLGNVRKGNCRFVSYAASFGGSSLPEKDTGGLQTALNRNFDGISLREESAVSFVQSLVTKTVRCVLDPTLLLVKSDWEKAMKLPKERDYILVYHTAANEEVFEHAYRLAKATNRRVLRLSSFITPLPKKYASFVSCRTAGPADFLGLFFAADYVVTNSFHGTVFSTIFEKNFAVFGYEGRSARITDFLAGLHLEDHFIKEAGQPVPETVDWKSVREALCEERKESIAYLKQYVN